VPPAGNANDRIQLAPLRASSGSVGSSALPPASGGAPAGAQAGGYHPVIQLRSSSRNGYSSSQSREGGDRNGSREGGRDADRKRNPLSIGSIISDDA
jgi:hypothetical protein